MASVTVKLFAVLRERLGHDSVLLEFDGSLTVASLLARMRAEHPAQVRVLDQCKVAVNRVFCPPDHPIQPGDEVALIPPIAGG